MGQPTTSKIMITFIEGDSLEFPNFEVDDLCYTGTSAFYENEASMLEDSIGQEWQPTKPGTYYIESYEVSYHTDYYGEVDADYYISDPREATPEDHEVFNKEYAKELAELPEEPEEEAPQNFSFLPVKKWV